MESYMANTIRAAGDDADLQLDRTVKRLLSTRRILADIMIHAIREFRTYTIDEAMAAIDGDPVISRKNLRSGRVEPETVYTGTNESTSSEKGQIYYDIVFYAHTREGERQQMWINVEAQRSSHPGYDLVTRGIFYSARLLSDELDKAFNAENYDDVKKVYSIWICMNPPRRDRLARTVENTIVEYRMTPSLLYSENETDMANIHTGRYDLMSAIFINLFPNGRSENELIGMLSALLSGRCKAEDRLRTLSEEYGLPITQDMAEEVQTMCNYSEWIVECALAEVEDRHKAELAEKDAEMQAALADKNAELADKDARMQAMQAEINALKAQLPAV